MRISGGILKGRRTATKKMFCVPRTVSQEKLRPTSAKVREAIFDIIKDKIVGASFVDLYAGTGTVGLEALSRGAEKVIFVEPNRKRAKMIKENLIKFSLNKNAIVVEKKAHEFLKRSPIEDKGFDIFFLDPPYFSDEIINILPVIEEKRLLSEDGLVIAEHFFKRELPELVGKLKIVKYYRYGDTMLTIYMRDKKQEN